MAAVLAAIITVATVMIQIPLPLSNGYINMGDTFILVGVWFSGMWAVPSAIIGSVIADLMTGYAVFAPATLVIKGFMALGAYMVYRAFNKNGHESVAGRVISAVIAETVMVAGYFLFSLILLNGNFYGALSGVAGNSVQGIIAVISAVAIMLAMKKTNVIKLIK